MDAITNQAIRELLDKQAIREILMRYAHGIDRLDFDLVRSCYHEGAFDHHGTYAGDVDGFIARMKEVLPRYKSTMHFLGNQLIELDGDVAKSETYCVAYHRHPPEDGHPEADHLLGVRYIDRMERRNGKWAIAHRVVDFEWRRVDPVPPGMEWSEISVRGRHGMDDYWYTGYIPPHPMIKP